MALYPRVGGGTPSVDVVPYAYVGLSPRGRGNRQQRMGKSLPMGSIPAWAGEPANTLMALLPKSVYPRVGGGTLACCAVVCEERGLSPRGRGNPSLS